MIGVGGMGTGRLPELLKHADARIGAICDVDRAHVDRAVVEVERAGGQRPKTFGDLFPDLLVMFSLRPTPLPGFEHLGQIGCVFQGTDAWLATNYTRHEVWVKAKRVEDFPRDRSGNGSTPSRAGISRPRATCATAIESRNRGCSRTSHTGRAAGCCGTRPGSAWSATAKRTGT